MITNQSQILHKKIEKLQYTAELLIVASQEESFAKEFSGYHRPQYA